MQTLHKVDKADSIQNKLFCYTIFKHLRELEFDSSPLAHRQ